MTYAPTKPVRNVPVGRTTLEAYRAVASCSQPILRASAIPFALLLGVVAMYALAVMLGGISAGALLVAMFILQYVGLTLFCVSVSRTVLLRPNAGALTNGGKWRPRHWRFVGYLAVFLFLLVLWIGLFVILGQAATNGHIRYGDVGAIWFALAMAVASVGLPYVFLRLCFIFPAVAVEEAYGLLDCWRLSKGQVCRLFIIVTLSSLPALAMHVLAVLLLVAFVSTGDDFSIRMLEWRNVENIVVQCFMLLVAGAVGYFWALSVLTPISIAFRTCGGWSPNSTPGESTGRSAPTT